MRDCAKWSPKDYADEVSLFRGAFQRCATHYNGVKHPMSAPYHPESKAINERTHATFGTMVTAICVASHSSVPFSVVVQMAKLQRIMKCRIML